MRVVHCKREPYDVYIGRPSQFGNPFSHLPGRGDIQVDSREAAIESFESLFRDELRRGGKAAVDAWLRPLAGKTLGCWCAPKACHGDVFVTLCKEHGLCE